jgi:hypothetical protein
MKLFKKYRGFVLTMCFLLIGQLAYSHVTRIRVKQNQNGSLTWYVQTYHRLGECGIKNSGININGKKYPLQAEHNGKPPISGTVIFADAGSTWPTYYYSYAVINTPYIPGALNVQPYSSNVCWAFAVGGSNSFTPPPPPVCTTPPVTSVSNRLGAPNNNNTECNATDDTIPVTLNISHLACGNITGDGQLSVLYSDGTLIGNVAYQNGISTPYTFNLPQGKLAQLTIVDNDFPNSPFKYTITGLNGTSFTGATNIAPITPVLADVNGQCNVSVPLATTTDNCGSTINGTTSDPLSYSVQGQYSITWTFDDGNGNIIRANQNVIVNDTTVPIIPVLEDVNGQCDATASVPTATDNCVGTINGTTSNATTYDTQGTHVITWTFDDGNGNIITANQNVIVKDTTVPIIPVLADVNGQCDATASVPAATDNCLGTINGTTSDPLTYAAQGTHVITWSFDDGNGNAITANQNVIVNDTIAPTAITQDITVTLDEYGNATITAADIDNGSSDNCTYTPSIDVTTFDCTNIDINNTVTLTVIDAAGNTDITTANVTILEHFKETLDLRSLSSFEAFTGTGAVTNSGNFTGNVGTNVGALTGFTGPNFNGSIHFNDALTAQAELDLLKVYIHLNNIPVTHPNANNAAHAPAFGSGEVLTPGVYDIGGAGSVAGTLTLNGQGDQNAVFIMKFKGAFTAGAGSNIVLTNGADAANVFWVAQGALSVGANSVIKGTLLAYPGAITLGVNSSIEGRLLSSVGAITVGVGGTATMPGTMNIPINPMISYTPAAAVDVLGSIENFSLFTSNGAVANASTSGILGDVGADVGAISGFATSAHIGSFYSADPVTAQAKIDLNNAYTQLMSIPTTVPNHTPAFGSGEILQPGVYSTPGAGSLAGIVTLDGQNNPDAIFIFKFNGAFAAAAQSKVILSNGTRRCNVFWISEGAASIGSFSTLKGTILAHNGAATMGAGGNLEGRLLSTGGAIGFSTGVVYTVVHDVECDTSTAQKTAVKTAVDTETISFEEELQVYPNPSKGIFNIKLSTVNVQTDIYLFDTTGKLIVRKSISKENNSGDLIRIGNNNLSSGIYLVKIITNNKAVTKKVIVEKR